MKNVSVKIAENLYFAENSNFIRWSKEAVACSYSRVNSQENTHGRELLFYFTIVGPYYNTTIFFTSFTTIGLWHKPFPVE